MKIITLEPSGTDDTAAVQAALDEQACVRLNGLYRICRPLAMTAPTKLEGDPVGTLFYTGPPNDTPLLSVAGSGAWLRRVSLWCDGKCRGLRVARDWYADILQSVRVYDSLRLGVELVDCWNGLVSDLRLLRPRGPALRASRCNSTRWDGLQISQCDLTGTDWPAELPEAERAVVSATGHTLLTVSTALFEGCKCDEYPAIYQRGCASRWEGVRFEAGGYKLAHIVIDGDGWWSGTNNAIDGVVVMSTAPTAEVLVELRGKTRDTEVRHVMASKYLRRAMVRSGPTHQGVAVVHSFAGNVPAVIEAPLPPSPPAPE